MARVRFIHWKPSEAKPTIEALRAAGHHVDYDEKLDSQSFGPPPPDAVVIDLSSRPSHGREVAIWLRGRKKTRLIPLVFVNGEPEKVEATRARIPDATYTTGARLNSALTQAISRGVVNPVVPAQMMERYKSRTSVQKLGITAEMRVAIIDPPREYLRILGDLPAGVELVEDSDQAADLTVWFIHDPESLRVSLPRMRSLAAKTKLWIAWRKQRPGAASSRVTQYLLRESTQAFGLVDYKICSLDSAWSAIAFARKTGAPKA